MADVSDCANALVTAIGATLYPNGTSSPSLTGAVFRIYRGWPDAAALDLDLEAGAVNVSVFATNVSRNTTRYMGGTWEPLSTTAPTLTATVAGAATKWTVTFGGTGGAGQVVGLARPAQGVLLYQLGASDTPATIPAILMGFIAQARANGPVLTFPRRWAVPVPVVRVLGTGSALQQVRRAEQEFRISVWSPDPTTRDAAAPPVDAALAATHWIPLADGSVGRLRYCWSHEQDFPSDGLYRRDLCYSVEYPTTLIQQQPLLLFGDAVLNGIDRLPFLRLNTGAAPVYDPAGNPVYDPTGAPVYAPQ